VFYFEKNFTNGRYLCSKLLSLVSVAVDINKYLMFKQQNYDEPIPATIEK
jgi:hypothetical protein